MKTKSKHLITLEEFKEKHYGKRRTKKRDTLEADYETFKTFHAKAQREPMPSRQEKTPYPLK